MKQHESNHKKPLSAGFRAALIGTAIALAPFSALAHGGGGGGGFGGGGGHGGGFGGGGGFHGGGGGFSHMGGGGGFSHIGGGGMVGGGGFSHVGGGGFSHMGGGLPNGGFSHMDGGVPRMGGSNLPHVGSAGGFAGGGVPRNTVGAINHNGGTINTLARGEGGTRQFDHAGNLTRQGGARNVRGSQFEHNRITRRFDDLARHGDRIGDFRFRRDRLFRTRDFLIGLVDFGWPVDLVDNWSDDIGQDEIVTGMPSGLVLDYWGNPLSVEAVSLPDGPAQIWTYNSIPNGQVRVTIMNNQVYSIERV